MSEFQKWLDTSPIASYLRVLLAMVVFSAVTEWAKAGAFVLNDWPLWLIGALAATLPTALRIINPKDNLSL